MFINSSLSMTNIQHRFLQVTRISSSEKEPKLRGEKIIARRAQLICAQTPNGIRRTSPHIPPQSQSYLPAIKNSAALQPKLSCITSQMQLHYLPFPAKKNIRKQWCQFCKKKHPY
jgi:hypothetical protein